MALRGFGPQTLTGAPQPLFGTALSAAVTPSPDCNTGRLDPGSANSSAFLYLSAPANLFRQGDHVMVGASNSFIQGSTTPVDGGTVQAVSLSASNILVTGLQRAHSAGEYVILAMPCAQINIGNGAAANLYLGEDCTVGPTSATLIESCLATGQITVGYPVYGNMVETQHLWVEGTASNTILPYMLTI
jgi:hypothetical protein